MSAEYDKKCGLVYAPKICNKIESEMFAQYFDQQVDYELTLIEKRVKEEKMLLKMSLIKIITFPVVYPLTRILLGKVLANDVLYSTKLYWKFLKKQITVDEMKFQLSESLKQTKLAVR